MAPKRIFGIGTVVIDHTVVLSSYPAKDTKASIQKHWRQVGGPVPVALSTAAHYGVPTSFAGCWGKDEGGAEIERVLTSRGVDLRCSRWSPSWSTGFAHVWTDESDGSRTIAFSRGESTSATEEDLEKMRLDLRTVDILHLDGAQPETALFAARAVKQHGGLVVLDAGSRKPGMELLMPMVDVLVASSLFCSSWFEHPDPQPEQLAGLGPELVIRTRGESGATLLVRNERTDVPATDVTPVDTNGAGDIFSGAFLVGLAHDWHPEQSLRFANAVAGYSVRFHGNDSLPSLDELRKAKLWPH